MTHEQNTRAISDRERALVEAMRIISMHGGYTKVHHDEDETFEVQAAYSEGVTAGYKELAEFARAALAAYGDGK